MSMIAQEYAAVTEAQLGNHVKFPDPEFAYVIFDMDLSHDTEVIHIDSIWTNNDDAIKRMRILEKAENEFLKKSPIVPKFRKARLSGYSEKFPYAEGLVIRRESENGLDWDPSFGIFCKRAFFNNKELIKR